MYLYHYHAIKQLGAGKTAYMDGLVKRETPLSGDWGEYQKLKRDIQAFNGGDDSGDITICSLSLLNGPSPQ